MTLRERLAQINRLQHGLRFKIVMTCVIAALAIGAGVTYAVWQKSNPPPALDLSDLKKPAEPEKGAKLTPEQQAEIDEAKARYEATEATARTINDILARKADPTVVFVGIGAVAGIALGVVWLGVGLTCMGVAIGAGLPLLVMSGGRLMQVYNEPHLEGMWANYLMAWHRLPGWTWFVASAGALALSFFVLMEALKVLLCGPHAVTAIARNVVSEAVRMRVSLVLLVLLMLGLAALPGMLDDATPLRYRVQSFLQYGAGGTFWVIAILVLFLAVATVAFEQRDKIIWQTMTKPVAPWQYILGKWLGVVGVAAVLLTVTASGVFLFTGYLRNQRAGGEVEAYVARDQAMSEDRLVLETQVLAARIAIVPILPVFSAESEEKAIDERMKRAIAGDQFFPNTEASREKFRKELHDELRTRFFSLGPGEERVFRFTGLKDVKRQYRPLTLRYKVSVGADDPRAQARVTFAMANTAPMVETVPLGQAMTRPVSPASIEIIKPERKEGAAPLSAEELAAAEDGVLDVLVVNGDAHQRMLNPNDESWRNTETMTFPPDGLEITFAVGGYESNFLRVMIVLWLKLAFLAMVAIWSATYLSFAVASLIAFATFLIAESASFLSTSLEYFNADDGKGNVDYFRVVIRVISIPIAETFKYYADLRPTVNLVDGRLVSWGTVGLSALVLGLLTGVVYAIAVMIFRRRELATYSGQ